MLNNGRYQFVYYRNGDRELYDREQDPNELQNLADNQDMTEVMSRLKEHLVQHMMDCQHAHMQTMKKVAFPPRLEMERAYREELRVKGLL